jgi:hypothetical protein
MHELKKIGKVFTSKFVATGPSSYKKRIYQAAVSQRFRNTGLHCCRHLILFINCVGQTELVHDCCYSILRRGRGEWFSWLVVYAGERTG